MIDMPKKKTELTVGYEYCANAARENILQALEKIEGVNTMKEFFVFLYGRPPTGTESKTLRNQVYRKIHSPEMIGVFATKLGLEGMTINEFFLNKEKAEQHLKRLEEDES
jgi:hypothetical protein